MSYFQPGESVDITITGARVVEVCRHGDGNGDDLRFTYEAKDGEAWPSAIWADAPGVTVERADPQWWPPRPGDLLRDAAGLLWFGVAYGSNVTLVTANSLRLEREQAWERRHALTLVHREEVASDA